MDANEAIAEYEADQVNAVTIKCKPVWHYYEDPFTGKCVWYDEEAMWDEFRGADEQTQFTKSPDEPDYIS